MTNKQPERSVDEIVEEVINTLADRVCLRALDTGDVETIEQILTQTLQAERQRCEEMVEAERERRYKIEILDNGATMMIDNSQRFYGFKRMTKPLMYEYEITLTQIHPTY